MRHSKTNRWVFMALTLLIFSSCSTYQYLTLDSPEIQKNDKKDFTWESDTMRLTYNFHGEGGPLSMTIYNKMNKPLLINWKKSALIRNGQAFSLFDHNVQVSGSYSGSSAGGRSFQTSSGNMSASFDLPDGVNLIPPGAFISKNLNTIVQPSPVYSTKFVDSTPKQKAKTAGGTYYTYKRYIFDQSASPLQFKSYLTFALAGNTEEFFVSHSFYAGEVMLSTEMPHLFNRYTPEGDKLYIRKPEQQ